MSLKTLREDLCRHESDPTLPASVAYQVRRAIAEVDLHRPLGPDGKHGERHTDTCGCGVKPDRTPLAALGLPTRVNALLDRIGVRTVADLRLMLVGQFWRGRGLEDVPGIGVARSQAIRAALRRYEAQPQGLDQGDPREAGRTQPRGSGGSGYADPLPPTRQQPERGVPSACMAEGCSATHPNHYWGRVRAHEAGWFLSKDGEQVYCPEHLPAWVRPWREGRADRNR